MYLSAKVIMAILLASVYTEVSMTRSQTTSGALPGLIVLILRTIHLHADSRSETMIFTARKCRTNQGRY